jgi:hypothetical protein
MTERLPQPTNGSLRDVQSVQRPAGVGRLRRHGVSARPATIAGHRQPNGRISDPRPSVVNGKHQAAELHFSTTPFGSLDSETQWRNEAIDRSGRHRRT